MRLNGKVAIVTGGGSGIGKSVAVAFHREGAKVLVADLSGAEKEVADTLGDGAAAFSVDVSDEGQVQAMIEACVSSFGGVDILANVAGIDGARTPLQNYDSSLFQRVMDVNLMGTFLAMKHAFPAMAQRGGGSVINMSSIGGLIATPTMAPYCSSKGGVVQLTRVGAIEGAPMAVRVNAICPGLIDTPLVRKMGEAAPEAIEGAKQMTPMGRMGRPEEISALALFLASDESPFLTGAAIPVDGGYTSW
ncbi:NAD(P)-dependent dehydrogenase (short-subunit alcohol dehydrogenase family) [Saccharomonospora amisosensis]|uniref:NAD(P)-dependent dehydrogenase (Short-subunit alcohol dehydrogenase family) n=1 Tax=Saccharomonospora amisosensis TaxID=1128677 RepID=A0A7X5UNA0_9PSEU|nr:SDR family NAD(P)-dependent oxidoreductase [Saccharomonospora amisosensis]NIJ11166.1 NAD(P)-dependent dehydrogenase (short-subunit alcohol dehydrogenase family) [Saccharomonospora amisosensis]